MDGFGGAWEIEMAKQRKLLLPKLIERFEARGVDYTKGYLAALQGGKPLWLLRLMHRFRISMGPYIMEEAAQEALRRKGIDPLTCGREFFARA